MEENKIPGLVVEIIAKKGASFDTLINHWQNRHICKIVNYHFSSELFVEALVWTLIDFEFVQDVLGDSLLNIIISPSTKID